MLSIVLDINCYYSIIMLQIYISVSYTHLTLPTKA